MVNRARVRALLLVSAVTSLLCLAAFGASTGSPLSGKAFSFGGIHPHGTRGRGGHGILNGIRSFLARFGIGASHGLPGVLLSVVVILAFLVAVVVTGAILMVLLGWLVARLRGRAAAKRAVPAPLLLPEAEEAGPDVALRRFVDAVARGLSELDEGDPRAGVIACWLRMQKAAAAAGTLPLASETASELVVRVLTGLAVTPGPLNTLADLFDEARFSTHTVDELMRSQAVAALSELQADLLRRPTTASAVTG